MKTVDRIIKVSIFAALATFMALAALVAFAACANPVREDDGVGGGELVYSATYNSSTTYTLTIQLTKARAVEPEAGNKYTLTAKSSASEKTSTGTVKLFYYGTTGDGVFYLQPDVDGASEFIVFTRDSSIQTIRNSITWDDGTRAQEPGSFYIPTYIPGGYNPPPPTTPPTNPGMVLNVPDKYSWDDAVFAIRRNKTDTEFTIHVTGSGTGGLWNDFGHGPYSDDPRAISVNITSTDINNTISLAESRKKPLLSIGDNQTVTMDNLTLKGHAGNDSELVRISGGIFGDIEEYASFTMNGGKVSGNTADGNGGGVYVYRGTFTMTDGTISGNTANSVRDDDTGDIVVGNGGGVYVYGEGTFTMNGGEVLGNTANSIYDYSIPEFVGGNGGGVYVYGEGTFNMNAGTISGNTADDGGGVHVDTDCAFTMTGGTISGNTATISINGDGGNGGGVYVYRGTFTMTDGTISGNTANVGGGVWVFNGSSTFRIVSGTIYGTDVTDVALQNKATTTTTATLYDPGDKAQFGTFTGANGAWVNGSPFGLGISSGAGFLYQTIRVVNGEISLGP